MIQKCFSNAFIQPVSHEVGGLRRPDNCLFMIHIRAAFQNDTPSLARAGIT